MNADGAVKVGVELNGKEREKSLARGGDGKVALFEGASWRRLQAKRGR